MINVNSLGITYTLTYTKTSYDGRYYKICMYKKEIHFQPEYMRVKETSQRKGRPF